MKFLANETMEFVRNNGYYDVAYSYLDEKPIFNASKCPLCRVTLQRIRASLP